MVLHAPTGVIDSVTFNIWKKESIRKLAVIEIDNPVLYVNQKPSLKSLRDPRLGITSRKGQCQTCGLSWKMCPGHFGYIELGTAMFHPGFLNKVIVVLKNHCHSCFCPITDKKKNNNKKCQLCGEKNPSIQKFDNWCISFNGKIKLPCEVLSLLNKIDKENSTEFSDLLLEVLPIPPSAIRPSPTIGGDEIRGEDEITRTLLRIVRLNETIKKHIKNSLKPQSIKNIIKKLQEVVSGYIYKTKAPVKRNSAITTSSIADRLRHKRGRFRGSLMGKRCNFTARTVITGDPNLGMHEVGVPRKVAETITITETIFSANLKKWQDNIRDSLNCKVKYIVTKSGSRIDLKFNKNPRIDIGYKVERMLEDGDIVLFNRQPSLHKMSIMAHYVRVMDYNTFRLNLSCTTPYNADFDGDEMNLHGLQTLESRAEAITLMAVKENIITPQSHRPSMAIVQDTLIGSYELSNLDTFLRKRYVFVVYGNQHFTTATSHHLSTTIMDR